MKKRILSALLALCLLGGPTCAAWAEGVPSASGAATPETATAAPTPSPSPTATPATPETATPTAAPLPVFAPVQRAAVLAAAAAAAPVYEKSKSKTATNLVRQSDGTYTAEVTLSMPAAEQQLVSDVMFVLDESSCTEPVKQQVGAMLESLYNSIADTGAAVKVGAVQYRGSVNELPFRELDASTVEEITAFMGQRPSVGGSNMHMGLLAAQQLLAADTDVQDDRKYVILVSDGIAYIWQGADGQNMGVNFANADSPNTPMLASPDAWGVKYAATYIPDDWDAYFAAVEALLQPTLSEKASVYVRGTDISADPFVTYPQRSDYDCTVDVALYYARTVYDQLAARYSTYAVTAGVESEMAAFAWGPAFMRELSGGATVDFDTIQNDIYYLLDAGSSVVDRLGYVAGDYNFDLVNTADALTMRVGDTVYPAVQLAENHYGFAPNGTGYDYELLYTPGDLAAGESFTWQMNVPVSSFAPVQLTYTVRLTNPKTEPGTYGVYDADGSAGGTALFTNREALLYPVDSTGTQGAAEPFAKPTVSYTVPQPATPSPTPSPTATPSPVPTASPSPTPKPTATLAPTARPTAAPTPTKTPAPTAAPTVRPTHTPAPTARPTVPQTGDAFPYRALTAALAASAAGACTLYRRRKH